MTAYDESTPESKHETYKVYTHIFDKHGKAPITKGAGGAPFTHHRGIFLGWSKTRFSGKSVDSWHMKGCVQVYKNYRLEGGRKECKLNNTHSMESSGWNSFIEEERTQVFRNLSDKGLFLEVDFKTTLKAPHAEVN